MAASIHGQLVELLSQLGDRAVAEKEARHIHAAMIAYSQGYDIGRNADGFYARPRRANPAGPSKEMRDLAAAARKAIRGKISREDWMDFWAAQPRSIWRACRPFLLMPETRSLDREKLLGNFSVQPSEDGGRPMPELVLDFGSLEAARPAPKFTMIIPKPEAVLPAIEVALELRKIGTGNKKQRKADPAAHEVIAVVRSAYSALTGNRGGRAILPSGQPGRLVRLGRDIDRLFGTKIFPNVDSRRLRKKSGNKRPLRAK
jgi:hypothetical protein